MEESNTPISEEVGVVKSAESPENPAETEKIEAGSDSGKKKKKKEKEVEDYLHNINVDQVLRETGLDMDGLCKLVGIDYQTVNRWKFGKDRNGNRPKYNAIVRLLRSGATTNTLFGVETPVAPSGPQKIVITDDLVAEMLARAGSILKSKQDEIK